MAIWHVNPTLADLNAFRKNTMLDYLGIEITKIGDDFLTATMPVDHRTRQPLGLLHGGASVALAESLGSTAAHLTIDNSKFAAVGIEINANHLRSVRDGFVEGTARPLHIGTTTQVWETKIVNETGKLVCVSRLTIAVIPLRGK